MSEGLVLPGKPERALRHAFTPKFGGPPDFRYCQGEWTKTVESVVIDDLPFAEGALRSCYRMQIVGKNGSRENVVAKVSKDVGEDKMTYYRDVQAQMCAKQWAIEYNAQNTPKKVDFIEAFVVELVDRPGRPLVGMEQFVEGIFVKHNNNVGGVVADRDSERATPNALSHFTWHASNNTLLVCDIQGVGDDYTDPQIHTVSGKGFGKGNLGQAGINAFEKRHVCNDICRTLNLPPLGPPGARRNTSSEDLRRMTPGHMAGGQSERERDAALRQLRGAQAEPDFPRKATLFADEGNGGSELDCRADEQHGGGPRNGGYTHSHGNNSLDSSPDSSSGRARCRRALDESEPTQLLPSARPSAPSARPQREDKKRASPAPPVEARPRPAPERPRLAPRGRAARRSTSRGAALCRARDGR